ncbi:MAG: hypothetical protein KDK66_06180 [Deltaproteobacteria bacterium]|nr:hypothetical protein [Deltaproteobacteria bacterium]
MRQSLVFVLALLLFGFGTLACDRQEAPSSAVEKTSPVLRTKEVQVEEDKESFERKSPYLIHKKAIGKIHIGDPLEDLAVLWHQKTRVESREGYEYKVYQSYQGADLVLEAWAAEDNTSIEQFEIFSPDFKTSQGLGVGVSIEELIKKCPNYKIWHSYVADKYILECPALESLQFQLDKKDYLGPKQVQAKQDQVFLKKEDFKKDAKVISVRIF